MRLATRAAVVLAVAVLTSATHARGHGISVRVHESQDMVTLAVSPGCAAGISEALTRQPIAGDVPGVELVRISSIAVCVRRVDADKREIDVSDANGEVLTLSLADAEPPLDRVAAGDTITFTVRRAMALRRLPAPPAEEPTPQR